MRYPANVRAPPGATTTPMYIVAIAWVYVIGMLSLGMPSFAYGLVVFLALGIGPLAALAWIASLRPARPSVRVIDERLHGGDGADAQADERDLLQGRAQVDALVQPGDEVGDRHVDHARRDEPQQ
jgi:hypothetical protein